MASEEPRGSRAAAKARAKVEPMRKLAGGLGIALGLTFTLAAATCEPYQNVGITSSPPGAEVFVDGNRLAHTPTQLPVATLQDHKVYLKLEGYRPELVVLALHRPGDGIYFLTPPDVHVVLQRGAGSSEGEVDVELEQRDEEP